MSDNQRREEILTPLDVKVEYRIPTSTQSKGRGDGSFAPHFRVGRRVYYRRSAVEQWITQQEQATAGDHRG